jgi:surfeit locus 1 family protein
VTALRIDLEWRTAVATLLLLPLFVTLGYWQLQRADEKAQLAAMFEQRQMQPEVALEDLGAEAELAYLPVSLRGEYLTGFDFLLDNRIQQGKYGVEVLSVLRLSQSGQLVLVNRGWLAADASRQQLPSVPAAVGELQLTGRIYVPPGEAYLLAEQVLAGPWPQRIQAIDVPLMASLLVTEGLGESLFPYSVRIDAGQRSALSVNWQVINVSPAKHTGYAVQWFSMALALFIIFVFRSSNLWQVLRGSKR